MSELWRVEHAHDDGRDRPGPAELLRHRCQDLIALNGVNANGGDASPLATGISELDRVLGGGFVAGSSTLLFGPPGVGKSTLLFQVLVSVASTGLDVVLASAEESLTQVAGRAGRMGRIPDHLKAIEGFNVQAIEQVIDRHRPTLVVVDSIQSISDPDLPQATGQPGAGPLLFGAPDEVGQVDRCPGRAGGSCDQGRRPGRTTCHRAPRRFRPLLRRRPSSRTAGADGGEAPLWTGRRGWSLRNARRRVARPPRPRTAHAWRPHGDEPGQRGGADPSGPPPPSR